MVPLGPGSQDRGPLLKNPLGEAMLGSCPFEPVADTAGVSSDLEYDDAGFLSYGFLQSHWALLHTSMAAQRCMGKERW